MSLVLLLHLSEADLEGVPDCVKLLLQILVYFRVPLFTFELIDKEKSNFNSSVFNIIIYKCSNYFPYHSPFKKTNKGVTLDG